MTFSIELTSGHEHVSLIEDPNGEYFLLDDTFRAPPPEPVDILVPSQLGLGERLLKRTYENRIVSLSCMVQGNTVDDVVESISKLYRCVQRASNTKTITSGLYSHGDSYSLGGYRGESGVYLRVRLIEGTPLTVDPRLTFKVISGRVVSDSILGQTGLSGGTIKGKRVAARVDIELQCQPYAIGHRRSLIASPTTYDWRTNQYLTIAEDTIVGDAPALTRIVIDKSSTSVGGYYIARESVNGFYNSTTYTSGTNSLSFTGNPAELATTDGALLESVEVRYGSTEANRYKMILSAQDSASDGAGDTEFRAVVRYLTVAGAPIGEELYDWVETGYVPNVMVDLGVFDIGYFSRPAALSMVFPDVSRMRIDIYARRKSGTLDNITLNHLIFVAVEEEDSWMVSTFQQGFAAGITISNFNYETPSIQVAPGSNFSHDYIGELMGYPITLAPGAINRIGFYPLGLYSGFDLRKAQLHQSSVTVNEFVYRPRYLFVG